MGAGPQWEIFVDNFAGGGGASLGIERAAGRVHVAINHSPLALAIHRANHPNTEHFEQSITSIDPLMATRGRPVGGAWFSPDCTDFSKAAGKKPLRKKIRDLAWVVPHWAERVRPRVIFVENVEEFQNWGPLDANGRRCKAQEGLTFRRWVRSLRNLGYKVEWRELRACDYGAPTTRKRLFVIARCDGRPIVWPEPTHGPEGSGLLPYRTAAECIDWSLPAKSIFEGRLPVVSTLRRIARGIERFVLDAADPFIIPLTHHGKRNAHSLHDPFRTITAANRGELALVAPWFISRYGERPGQDPRTRSVDRPGPTVVPTGNGHVLCAAYMAQQNTRATGHPMTRPVSTICTKGSQQQLVTSHLLVHRNHAYGQSLGEPLRTITAAGNHFAEIRTLLREHGNGSEPRLTINGVDLEIADIMKRMLSARELFSAQGFPADYVIDPICNGKRLSKTAQVRACGNSVCPQLAEALVGPNVQLRQVDHEEAPLVGGLFG